MKVSLKAQNRPWIIAFSLAVGALLWWTVEPFGFERLQILDDLYGSIFFVAIASIFTLAVGELFPRKTKLFLVYWKWANPSPGCQAFSKLIHDDHRIDVGKLEAKHGPFPDDPADQDRMFYAIYKPLDGETSVDDAHKSYLLFRELTCLSAVFAIFGSAMAGMLSGELLAVAIFLGFSLLLYLSCAIAAQNAGKRMVANVLAIESTR